MRALRRASVLIAALAPMLVLITSTAVSAHTGFESSDPADGTSVDAPVEEVTIRFSGPATPAGEGFVIRDPSGTVRPPDSAQSNEEQTTWTLRFDPPLAGGTVGVRWTVQAPDAHPITGSFSFLVTGQPEAADTDLSSPLPRSAPTGPARESPGGDAAPTGERANTPGVGPPTPNAGTASESDDLTAFLQQADPSAPNAESVGALGRLLAFVGTMLGIGGLSFAAVVVRNHIRDLRSVLKAVRYAAALVVLGTVVDLAAHLATASGSWGTALDRDAIDSVAVSPVGLAIGLRVVAGGLLFAAAKLTYRRMGSLHPPVHRPELAAFGSGHLPFHSDVATDDPGDPTSSGSGRVATISEPIAEPAAYEPVVLRPVSTAAIVAIVALLASFTFDGHTVTEGNRLITGAVDMVHVVAASIWVGGVVAFAVVLWRRHRRQERLYGLDMALRFSVIAGAALAVAGIAGLVLAAIILDSISELWTTPWGRLLVAKTATVAAAAMLGSYNHFVVIPWMNEQPDDDTRSMRIRNTVTAEAALLGAVIIVTAILVGASSQP